MHTHTYRVSGGREKDEQDGWAKVDRAHAHTEGRRFEKGDAHLHCDTSGGESPAVHAAFHNLQIVKQWEKIKNVSTSSVVCVCVSLRRPFIFSLLFVVDRIFVLRLHTHTPR